MILTLGAVAGFVRMEQIAERQESVIMELRASQRVATQEREANVQRFAASDARQIEVLRTILCLAQRQTLTSRQRTPEEKRIAVAFYQEALRQIHASSCDFH